MFCHDTKKVFDNHLLSTGATAARKKLQEPETGKAHLLSFEPKTCLEDEVFPINRYMITIYCFIFKFGKSMRIIILKTSILSKQARFLQIIYFETFIYQMMEFWLVQ